MKHTSAKAAARCINRVLHTDSNVFVPIEELEFAVERDSVRRGRYPSEGEIDELVMGDADSGVDDISKLWPETAALLAEQF